MKLLSFQRHYYSSFANSSLKFGTILSELVKKKISIGNVLDIGSGTCELVYGFSKNDLDFVAIDKHDEKISEKYLGNNNFFFKLDITKKIDLKKKFDCCICIEVLEHVENSNSDNVIQNLIRHSDFIIFSSAQNGQGGLNHINEQPLDYWINKFKKYDSICFDYIRPQILLKKYHFFINQIL